MLLLGVTDRSPSCYPSQRILGSSTFLRTENSRVFLVEILNYLVPFYEFTVKLRNAAQVPLIAQELNFSGPQTKMATLQKFLASSLKLPRFQVFFQTVVRLLTKQLSLLEKGSRTWLLSSFWDAPRSLPLRVVEAI